MISIMTYKGQLFQMNRTRDLIREYVMDHYKHFGFYPADVEVDDVLYTYNHYMHILSMTV